MTGRRVHAELCEGYQLADAKEKLRRELRSFNKKNRRRGVL